MRDKSPAQERGAPLRTYNRLEHAKYDTEKKMRPLVVLGFLLLGSGAAAQKKTTTFYPGYEVKESVSFEVLKKPLFKGNFKGSFCAGPEGLKGDYFDCESVSGVCTLKVHCRCTGDGQGEPFPNLEPTKLYGRTHPCICKHRCAVPAIQELPPLAKTTTGKTRLQLVDQKKKDKILEDTVSTGDGKFSVTIMSDVGANSKSTIATLPFKIKPTKSAGNFVNKVTSQCSSSVLDEEGAIKDSCTIMSKQPQEGETVMVKLPSWSKEYPVKLTRANTDNTFEGTNLKYDEKVSDIKFNEIKRIPPKYWGYTGLERHYIGKVVPIQKRRRRLLIRPRGNGGNAQVHDGSS
jgi:hypothetical protein